MKPGTYNKYYKLGLEHFVNKHFMNLQKPSLITDVFYMTLMILIITVTLSIG